jgi:hypothetical protein
MHWCLLRSLSSENGSRPRARCRSARRRRRRLALRVRVWPTRAVAITTAVGRDTATAFALPRGTIARTTTTTTSGASPPPTPSSSSSPPSSPAPSSSCTDRAPSAPLTARGGRLWTAGLALAFRRGSGRRRRFVVVAIIVFARLALSFSLLAKVVDDLLQPFARIRFALSRGHHAAGGVDGKVFVQIALLIQRLRLQYHRVVQEGHGGRRKKTKLSSAACGDGDEKRLAWLRFRIFWIIGNRSSSTLDWLHPSSCKRKLNVSGWSAPVSSFPN